MEINVELGSSQEYQYYRVLRPGHEGKVFFCAKKCYDATRFDMQEETTEVQEEDTSTEQQK